MAQVVASWDIQSVIQKSSLPPPYSVLLRHLQHMGALTQEYLSSSEDYLRVMCTLQHTYIPYSCLLVPKGAYGELDRNF